MDRPRVWMEIYKQYGEVLLPNLLQTLNQAFESFQLPDSMNAACIIVLPKLGKDFLESNRPISLLNSDLNFLPGYWRQDLTR